MGEKHKLNDIIEQLENYLECLKQFHACITEAIDKKSLTDEAAQKKSSSEDEMQFLEIKSNIAQQSEIINAAFEQPVVNRDEIHQLLGSASSIRNLLSMNENALRGLEAQWHRLYLDLQGKLGQLKVQQKSLQSQSFWSGVFGKKKK